MPLTKLVMATVVVLTVSWLPSAYAQRVDDGSDRFFTAKVATDKDDESAMVTQGSVTSTTFVYRELGGDAVGVADQFNENYNFSKVTRFFTDLRAQLDVKRLDGKGWSVRTDARVRISPGCAFNTNFNGLVGDVVKCRVQSGILAGNEYDIRELYAKRSSGKTDIFIGRQFVPELAATKLDGLKFHYAVSKRWKLIGFGGLNPSRISRSILTDYPAQREIVNLTPGQQQLNDGTPILPITAGMGGTYRTPNVYGSLGVVGIVPIADDRDSGGIESPRIFVADNGYWRPTSDLDIYHYLVFDIQGAGGFALTNFSLGANYRPKPGLTLSGALNRVDTETLNSITQTQILEAPVNADSLPYNYQDVIRVASDSANVGASYAFARQRFEVSTRAFFRQRGEIALAVPDGGATPDQILPAARSAELRISVLDRRSLGGMRLGASFSAIFPLSNNTPNRSKTQMASITGSRLFMDDRMEYDVNLAFISSSDIKEVGNCLAPINCFGNSDVMSVQTNNLLYYRFSSNWLGIANLGFGIQRFTAIADDANAQPLNLMLSGMGRVAYRF